MTVVNEHARVPPLDAAALERLARSLDREGVVAAMLIYLDTKPLREELAQGLRHRIEDRFGRRLDDLRQFAAFAQSKLG